MLEQGKYNGLYDNDYYEVKQREAMRPEREADDYEEVVRQEKDSY